MSVLFLAKTTEWCRVAERFALAHLKDVTVCTAALGDPLPEAARTWNGDIILSFLSPWIVPGDLLQRANVAALNFHPGPPEYPGIGCYNFALYDQVPQYGVTCHRMAARVDTGAIVRVSRFAVSPRDTVATLKDRSMNALLALFCEIVETIERGDALPSSAEEWTRKPYTRRELDELGRITADMPTAEVQRRFRAMNFPPYPGLFTEIGGITFRA